jgi:serine/threonine protein kinase
VKQPTITVFAVPFISLLRDCDSAEWKIGKLINRGAYGSVFPLERQGSAKPVTEVVKLITPFHENGCKENNDFLVRMSNMHQLFRELCSLALIDHPGIAKLTGWNLYPQAEIPTFALITKFYAKGDLKQNKDSVDKLVIIYGIMRAVYFMHRLKMIHRDLKPKNVLIDVAAGCFEKRSANHGCRNWRLSSSGGSERRELR